MGEFCLMTKFFIMVKQKIDIIHIAKCTFPGLSAIELQTEMQDIHFMRMAERLAAADMYPLTAGLLGNVDLVMERTEGEFPEMRPCDRTFVIMAEWRKRLNEKPSAEKMARVFEEMGINKHIVCMVCL